MTPEQRRDHSNGIWLCQTLAKLIDWNTGQFSVETLAERLSSTEYRDRPGQRVKIRARLTVAVGTAVASRPPHRSRRALLTHRAYMRTQLSRGICAGGGWQQPSLPR